MSQYFPKPYESFTGNITVELDFSNYATKTDLKGATGMDASNSAPKSDLGSIKAEVDKIDIDKLKTVPVDLSELSKVVDNDVVKKTVYDKLFATVNAIDIGGFVLKMQYSTDKLSIYKLLTADKKIPDISEVIKKIIIMQKLLR